MLPIKRFCKTKECKECICSICKKRSDCQEHCDYCECSECDDDFAESHFCCQDFERDN